MKLHLAPYAEQAPTWPATGKHLMAQYDASTLVVYQAYNRTIADFAVRNGHFGEGFSFSRMTWVKPNFLWMMYRCGWCTKDANQERVLALWLHRSYFDGLLVRAVASTRPASHLGSEEAWKRELQCSDVRLQWDPDHDPAGRSLERRAIQLGLRGEALEGFRGAGIVAIEDITDFVVAQRPSALEHRWNELVVPMERPYEVVAPEARLRLGLA